MWYRVTIHLINQFNYLSPTEIHSSIQLVIHSCINHIIHSSSSKEPTYLRGMSMSSNSIRWDTVRHFTVEGGLPCSSTCTRCTYSERRGWWWVDDEDDGDVDITLVIKMIQDTTLQWYNIYLPTWLGINDDIIRKDKLRLQQWYERELGSSGIASRVGNESSRSNVSSVQLFDCRYRWSLWW